MKTSVLKVVLLIVDHDNVGASGIIVVLENQHYPNHCILPTVMAVDERVVDWGDAHPLNNQRTMRREFEALFARVDQTEQPARYTWLTPGQLQRYGLLPHQAQGLTADEHSAIEVTVAALTRNGYTALSRELLTTKATLPTERPSQGSCSTWWCGPNELLTLAAVVGAVHADEVWVVPRGMMPGLDNAWSLMLVILPQAATLYELAELRDARGRLIEVLAMRTSNFQSARNEPGTVAHTATTAGRCLLPSDLSNRRMVLGKMLGSLHGQPDSVIAPIRDEMARVERATKGTT